MIDGLKKGLMLGVGLANMTKKKVEKATENFVKANKISAQEAEKFTKDVLVKAQKQQKAFVSKVNKEVKRKIKGMVPKKEVQNLKKQVNKLQKELTAKSRQLANAAAKKVMQKTAPKKKKAATAPKSVRAKIKKGAAKKTAKRTSKKK